MLGPRDPVSPASAPPPQGAEFWAVLCASFESARTQARGSETVLPSRPAFVTSPTSFICASHFLRTCMSAWLTTEGTANASSALRCHAHQRARARKYFLAATAATRLGTVV